jgi:hypothetical protein
MNDKSSTKDADNMPSINVKLIEWMLKILLKNNTFLIIIPIFHH